MITRSDKALAYLTLFSGLAISAVAVWYSVAGLMAIFAAAAIPIMIMGVALELSKLVATVWLKWNWHRAPRLIKTYLMAAIIVLMIITSMGIFGYLSKAHLDQAVPTGDVADKVALIDEKIKTERENIDAARKALQQMDTAVDQLMARSDSEQGAQRAANLRRQQAKERTALQNEIAGAQKRISVLNDERAPIAKELRKVEAEVGPIKYIAALIYGDNPDANLLEAAVRWVIIVIVLVFDPLAVILLLASQYSFQWFRKEEEQNPQEQKQIEEEPLINEEMSSDVYELENIKTEPEIQTPRFDPLASKFWPFPIKVGKEDTLPEAEELHKESIEEEKETKVEDDFKFLAEDKDLYPEGKPWEDQDDTEIIADAQETEKAAMKAWKQDHPDGSLKMQRRLYEKGVIDKLPWENYLKPVADFTDDEAAVEAAKWAMEQIEKKTQPSEEESKKKDSDVDGVREQPTGQEEQRALKGYVQNSEQNSNTIWNKIKKAKGEE